MQLFLVLSCQGWKVRSIGCGNKHIIVAADDSVIAWGIGTSNGELVSSASNSWFCLFIACLAKTSSTLFRCFNSHSLDWFQLKKIFCGGHRRIFILRKRHASKNLSEMFWVNTASCLVLACKIAGDNHSKLAWEDALVSRRKMPLFSYTRVMSWCCLHYKGNVTGNLKHCCWT